MAEKKAASNTSSKNSKTGEKKAPSKTVKSTVKAEKSEKAESSSKSASSEKSAKATEKSSSGKEGASKTAAEKSAKSESSKTSSKASSKGAGAKEAPSKADSKKSEKTAGIKESSEKSHASSKASSKASSEKAASPKAAVEKKIDEEKETSSARSQGDESRKEESRKEEPQRQVKNIKITVNKENVSKVVKKLPKAKGPFIVVYALLAALLLSLGGIYFFRPDIWNEGVTRFDDFLYHMGIHLEVEIVLDDEETYGQEAEEVRQSQDGVTEVLSKSGASAPLTAENLSLYFGNPSDATVEVKNAKNYLVEKVQYSMSYNSEKLIPNWVMWHLSTENVGSAERGNDFRPDETLPKDYYAVKKADYQYMKYGFDRGHVCPSADRTTSAKDNSETFLMTNMIPQSPNCNRNVWKNLEAYERSLALDGNELYIIAGPYGRGGTSERGSFKGIPLKNGMNIEVPSHCWKIIMILPEGKNDVSRVNENTKVLAAFIPNDQECAANTWDAYITDVDYIEEKTSYDFLEILEDSLEDTLEAKKYKL
ncbi:MAG: DNA/RNA non-specific endonuclease [Treponema sp.]|nr:DNA/RNA non-specific endonuclease [Treponema sp.]